MKAEISPNIKRLPPPSAKNLTQSQAAIETLRQQLQQNIMPFDEFMQFALYHPTQGYYMKPEQQFGDAGDFVTAPTRSPLFGRALGQWCSQLSQLKPQQPWHLIEWGGGHGDLLCELLHTLQAHGTLPDKITCVELSPSNRQIITDKLTARYPTLLNRCQLSTELPETDDYCLVIANELLDALPTIVFTITEDGICEQAVRFNRDNELTWVTIPARASVQQHIQRLQTELELTFPVGYTSEVTLATSAIFQALAKLTNFISIFIDYGYPQSEFYLLDRHMGTLMCYFQQHAQTNPLLYPGCQDITAHVDFSFAALCAKQNNLDVIGFANQAAFLLDGGLRDCDLSAETTEAQLQIAQELKQLLLANTMGETFKVLAVGKDIPTNLTLPGFNLKDQSHRL